MTDRIRALEEALQWYAEQARLARLIHNEGDAGRHALAADGGNRARAALEASQPAQPVAVKVKPLVWEQLGERAWRAPSPLFGSFRVECYGGSPWQALWSVPGFCDTFVDGDFATADDAMKAIESRILASLDVQPITLHDAARVSEIAALIEKSEALRDDVTGRVDAFGERIGTAQPMIGFGAKQWADFITALRAIAEGRA